MDALQELLNQTAQSTPRTIERRVYYDDQGRIITYTCDNLPGNYILVTPEQFAEARPDAIVRDGQLVYTHKVSHVGKLVQASSGQATSAQDINIIVPAGKRAVYWQMQLFPIINE